MPNIFRTGRPTKFKLGTQTEHEDPYQRQAPWPPRHRQRWRSQGHVTRLKVLALADKSRMKRPRNTKIGGKVGYHPTDNNAYMFQGQMSKVKVTWSITLHNNTLFRTTIAFYSHSLGGDTSTKTLPPRFIVIRYSLGGDTDEQHGVGSHSMSTFYFLCFLCVVSVLLWCVCALRNFYCCLVHIKTWWWW